MREHFNKINHIRTKYLAISSIFAMSAISSCAKTITADTIVFNSKIWTGDENNKTAHAFAIKGDSILVKK